MRIPDGRFDGPKNDDRGVRHLTITPGSAHEPILMLLFAVSSRIQIAINQIAIMLLKTKR
jgi:hypothetical protein